MFDSLRKKISSWFSKQEEKPGKEKKKSAEKKVKTLKKTKKNAKEKLIKKKQKLEVPVPTQVYKAEKTIKKSEEIDEEIKEEKEEQIQRIEKKPEEIQKEGFFSKLIKRISSSKLTQEQFDEFFMEFELTLLENNVALEVVDKIKENLSLSLVNQEIKKADAEKKVLDSLKEAILSVLIEPDDLIKRIKDKRGVFTILFFGINGSGKTTSIAKISHLLKKHDISSVLVAADTFRAASIEQLKTHGENLGIPVISHNYGSDPAAVAFDGKKYAEKNNIKVVLIDTAGRMYTKQNLLKEMEKIIRVSQPDLKIFVGESITGNDAVEQARIFNETCGIDGIILSKADIDEKAGTILSVSFVTKKPIYYLGAGQSYDDLIPFTKKEVLKNLGLE